MGLGPGRLDAPRDLGRVAVRIGGGRGDEVARLDRRVARQRRGKGHVARRVGAEERPARPGLPLAGSAGGARVEVERVRQVRARGERARDRDAARDDRRAEHGEVLPVVGPAALLTLRDAVTAQVDPEAVVLEDRVAADRVVHGG